MLSVGRGSKRSLDTSDLQGPNRVGCDDEEHRVGSGARRQLELEDFIAEDMEMSPRIKMLSALSLWWHHRCPQ